MERSIKEVTSIKPNFFTNILGAVSFGAYNNVLKEEYKKQYEKQVEKYNKEIEKKLTEYTFKVSCH